MMIARWHNLANTSPDDARIIVYLWILPGTDPRLGMMDFFSGVPCPATDRWCTVQFCIYFLSSSASTRQSINIKFLCVFCKEQYLHCYICLHSWPPIADRRTSIQARTRSQYSCCCFFMLMLMQHWMSEQDQGRTYRTQLTVLHFTMWASCH